MDKTNKSSVKDIVNIKFGRLTVIERGPNQTRKCGQKFATWICKCDCGNTAVVAGYRLRNGSTKSCGCFRSEMMATHRKSNTKLYSVWASMRKRCNSEKDDSYKHYGGRGIKVCDAWNNSFEEFYKWSMENGYKEGLSIDRIDVNGDYYPENCRWATWIEQANNTRKNKFLTFNGETYTMAEWARITGIPEGVIQLRLSRLGWSVERALTEKVRGKNGHYT